MLILTIKTKFFNIPIKKRNFFVYFTHKTNPHCKLPKQKGLKLLRKNLLQNDLKHIII